MCTGGIPLSTVTAYCNNMLCNNSFKSLDQGKSKEQTLSYE
ncbi:hypothetical protein R1080702_112 [Cyanophage S-RIM32]|uniref:Uncharacterized protein n=1 Tax=Cyanophage S-RIM32 TaxID=1278479 RepID=A0A127KMD3_9CAUD|nr:hypothetical protein BJD26_gp144 [Cyanophage S-RIM32]AMO43121.1 hypothetical protein R1080702_112 [Cyanophage S-RIM32]